jgi:potassium efflux system protein
LVDEGTSEIPAYKMHKRPILIKPQWLSTHIPLSDLNRFMVSVLVLWAAFFLSFSAIVHAADLPLKTTQGIPADRKKKEQSELPTIAETEKAIERIKERTRLAELSENEQTAQQAGVSLSDLQARTGKLRSIQTLNERLLTALKKRVSLEEEEIFLKEKIEGKQEGIGVVEKPPYPLSFYDELLDEISNENHQKETTGLALKLALRAIEDTKLRFANAQKNWRNLKDQLEATSAQGPSLKLTWDLGQAEIERDLSGTLLSYEKVNHQNLSKQLTLSELKIQLIQRKVDWVRKNLYFDGGDLQKHLAELVRARTETEERIQELVLGREKAEEAWLQAQREYTSELGQKSDPIKKAYLEERDAWRNTYQTVIEHTVDKLRLIEHQEQMWRLRYALIKGEIQGKELSDRGKNIETHLKNIERSLNLQQSHQSGIQSQIMGLEKRLSAKDLDISVRPHLQNQISALQKLSERLFEYTSELLRTAQLDRRLLDEIGLGLEQITLKQQLETVKGKVKKIWDFELWVIDNNAVTVKKLIVALIILIIGILAAKYVLRIIGNRLLRYAHLKETTTSAVQKVLTYVAYLLILLFALRIVNIPLAAFAFLGGAIAIGIGFGAQNLINNFISGFIMMAERPINIGDLIELEGIVGKVEEIGARCTRVRTGENIHILVPNSSFLEKNITNWTLSDRRIRTKVTAGVIYGSPVRKVEELMIRAVIEEKKTLKTPAPFVLFNDFGDNALVFEVYFWITIHQIIERRIIESTVRFRIDDLFREAGIVIAFPQRDVHFDADKPLKISMIDTEE